MEKSIKRVWILFVVLSVVQTMFASDFVEDGKTWECEYRTPAIWSMPDYQPKKVVYYFDGDTIVNGRTCLNMYCTWEGQGKMFVAPFYEEGAHVYFYPFENAPESVLLYDFSAQAGDSISLSIPSFRFSDPYESDSYSYLVTAVSDTLIEGNDICSLIVTNANLSQNLDVECWLFASFGTLSGPFGFRWWDVTGAGMVLEKCYTKNKTYYVATDYHPILQDAQDAFETPAIDLLGRPTSLPTSGIYIQNGRKVMVR